ncbi:MAG: response regulator [bacterium]|nr:response regulator [bacterium]
MTKYYAIIIFTGEMETLNGMTILAKLKQINDFNIPVVLMSKDSNVEYNNDYLQAGFNDIIIKPINKDTLLNIINKY